MPEPFALLTGDPAFDPRESITVNGYKFIPAAEQDRRVTELLEANNRELEMRRELTRKASEVREQVAKLYCASGCSCCRDDEGWNAATAALGEALVIPKYEDGSGYDFYRVRDEAAGKQGEIR